MALREKVLPDLDNIEEILPQKTGEQTLHICLSVDVSGDPSDTNVGEKEVTQSSELGEKEKAPRQLRQPERIQKSNPKYVNTTIIEDEVEELKTYKEVS